MAFLLIPRFGLIRQIGWPTKRLCRGCDEPSIANPCRNRWGRRWRTIRRKCADRTWHRRIRLRTGDSARRDWGGVDPYTQQHSALAPGETGIVDRAAGSEDWPGLRLLPARRHTD